MPNSRAMAAAVAAWSPVIITVRMPAAFAFAIARAASGRGGSIMPTNPLNVRSDSTSAIFSGSLSILFEASAITRSASFAKLSCICSMPYI